MEDDEMESYFTELHNINKITLNSKKFILSRYINNIRMHSMEKGLIKTLVP